MSMIDWLIVLSPLAGLAVNAVSLVLLYRLRPAFGLLRSEYAGFSIGALVVLMLNGSAILIGPSRGPAAAAGHGLLTLLSYGALGYCHFHFVNLGETARRIRLLRELLDAGGRLSHRDLLARYGAREIVEKRITRLINAGQVVHRNGRYYIGNPLVLRIAQGMVGLKVLLLGRKSEYDNS
jgi:hypothetical protein